MKLQNQLRLYSLHDNPQLLYGHDKLHLPGPTKKFNIEKLYLLIDAGLDFDFMLQKFSKNLGYDKTELRDYRDMIEEIIYEAIDILKYDLGGFDKKRLRNLHTPAPDKRPLLDQAHDFLAVAHRFDRLYQNFLTPLLDKYAPENENEHLDRFTNIEYIILDIQGWESSLW